MGPTDEKEIEQKIKVMKDKKNLGPNSIRTKSLKVHSKTLSKPLAELINLLLNQGKFPAILKIATVIPIHKRGDKSECDNYRPISLISKISKLIERQCMKDFILSWRRSKYYLKGSLDLGTTDQQQMHLLI